MFFFKKTLTFIILFVFNYAISQDISSEISYNNTLSDQYDKNGPEAENQISSGSVSFKYGSNANPDGVNAISVDLDNSVGTAEISFLAPISGDKFKRGNSIQIRWTGGNPDDEFSLDLFSGRFHYRHVGELKNSGTYPWIIPTDVEPGKEYKFKLTNTDDFGEYVFSETFIIKRRVPVVVWIIPGALVVGGVTYLIFSGEKPEPDLPAPIEPN